MGDTDGGGQAVMDEIELTAMTDERMEGRNGTGGEEEKTTG